jgi:hypothetical protein
MVPFGPWVARRRQEAAMTVAFSRPIPRLLLLAALLPLAAISPAQPSQGADAAEQPKKPATPTRNWPRKYDPSDLNAKNSETAVELLELSPSQVEICEDADDSKCAGQQPAQKRPRPESRKPE